MADVNIPSTSSESLSPGEPYVRTTGDKRVGDEELLPEAKKLKLSKTTDNMGHTLSVEELGYEFPIYVRKAYFPLYKLIRKELDEPMTREMAIRVTGTPGTGKSYFMGYMWHMLKNDHTVVALRGTTVFRSTPGGSIEVKTLKQVEVEEWLTSDVVFLADPKEKNYSVSPSPARTILFVSPSKRRVGEYKQVSLINFYFPAWEKSELRNCFEMVCPGYLVKFDDAFKKWGGNPRIIINAVKGASVASEFDMFLESQDLIDVTNKVWNSNHLQYREVETYQWLIHFCPANDYRKFTYKFCSEYVTVKITDKINGLKIDWKTTKDSTALGRLYENHVRRKLLKVSEDDKFLPVEAQNAKSWTKEMVKVPAVKLHEVFSSKNPPIQSPKDGVLYIPVEFNRPGFDFLMPPWIFQVTLRKEHDLKNIDKLCKQFPSVEVWKLCFVIPPAILTEFTVPRSVDDFNIDGVYKLPFNFGRSVDTED